MNGDVALRSMLLGGGAGAAGMGMGGGEAEAAPLQSALSSHSINVYKQKQRRPARAHTT